MAYDISIQFINPIVIYKVASHLLIMQNVTVCYAIRKGANGTTIDLGPPKQEEYQYSQGDRRYE